MEHFEQEQQLHGNVRETNNFHLKDETIIANMEVIHNEVEWLKSIIEARLADLEENDAEGLQEKLTIAGLPDLSSSEAAYAKVISKLQFGLEERLLFILTFLPYYNPSLLTSYFRDEQHSLQVKHPEVGGLIKSLSRQFVPTIQTFQFLLCGFDQQEATKQVLLLRGKSKLFMEGIVKEQGVHGFAEPHNDHEEILTVSAEFVDHLRSSQEPRPKFSPTFPAQLVESNYEWEDVVFHQITKEQFQPLMDWLLRQETLRSRSAKWKVTAPILFYGSPGTGKSMTAQLIGKTLERDVFRVDLSMIVSKYVGETEKNLAHLFDKAENKDWILFFDEADGLFAKRTGVSNANDKWANMGVNYLLQRMESFKGISILATNIKENLDAAMSRRFRYMIKFPRPSAVERKQLWTKLLPEHYRYDKRVNLDLVSKEDLTGANIANIILDCAVAAEKVNTHLISRDMIQKCVIRELQKEDRTPTYVIKNEIHPTLMHLADSANGVPTSQNGNQISNGNSPEHEVKPSNGQQKHNVELSAAELDLIRKYRQQNGSKNS